MDKETSKRMNIYENVDIRASRTLSTVVQLFPLPLRKQTPFTYRTESESYTSYLEVRYTYIKKWISRVYKLEIIHSFAFEEETSFELVWDRSKRIWKNIKGNGDEIAQTLNGKKEIRAKLSGIDMERVAIKKEGEWVTVSLVPIPGCFIWTLLPPIHYHVKVKPEEVDTLTKLAKNIRHVLHSSLSSDS